MMRVLVTGSKGQVGYELVRALAPQAEVVGVSRADVDLSDAKAVRNLVRSANPRVLINAAAYTAVDRAEDDIDSARTINAELPAALAEECMRLSARLVHFSTDYVFDGFKRTPYLEEDETRPLNVYGQTKLAGERSVLEQHSRNLVIRLSWVYGNRGLNFMISMLRAARAGKALRVVADQFGSPTWSRDIGEATGLIVRDLSRHPDSHGGLVHLSASGTTSWYGFAEAIFRLHPEFFEAPVNISEIGTNDYPTRALRPAYSALDNRKVYERFGVQIPPWEQSLTRCLES